MTKTITTWPEDVPTQPQHCFQHTEWSVFEHQDLTIHTEAVLSYIKFCMGNVTVDKHIQVFPHQKPLMNSQVKTLQTATPPSGLVTENYTVLPGLTWKEESGKKKQSTDKGLKATSPTTTLSRCGRESSRLWTSGDRPTQTRTRAPN